MQLPEDFLAFRFWVN